MRLLLSDGHGACAAKVEAGFAGAIKLVPIARTYLGHAPQDMKWARFADLDLAPDVGNEGAPTAGGKPAWMRLAALCTSDSAREARPDRRSRPYQDPLQSVFPQTGPAPKGLVQQRLWPPRHTIQINVLLCILKGFALAKPLCCPIR